MINPWEPISARQYLEEQLEMAAATRQLILDGPEPATRTEARRRLRRLEALQQRRDDIFCALRDRTNPKYGGDPHWDGTHQERARHAAGDLASPRRTPPPPTAPDNAARRLHDAVSRAEHETGPDRDGRCSAERVYDACVHLVDAAKTVLVTLEQR